jgi:CubicO group peptidase (beta-lactamase class C family)
MRRYGRYLILLLGLATATTSVWSAEDIAGRRVFFEPDGRAHKFQTAASFFPSRVVHASSETWELPRGKAIEVSYSWQGKTYSLEEFNVRTYTSALLILKDGAIVTEKYLAGSNPDTRFVSFSTGKSFTSTLVGMALDDGLLESLSDPLTKYLPSLTGSAYDGVTIENALEMSSGVGWDEEAYDWNDTTKPLIDSWNGAMVEERYRFVEYANKLPRAHAPGEKFNYNTLESAVLGWLVETVTKKRLATYMEERLWRPAGMESGAAWLLDGPEPIGREMAGGLLLATLRDYGRFGLLMMNGGKARGRQIVSADWVQRATHPQGNQVAYGKLYGDEDYPLGYGYQWWLFPNGRFEAQGVYGQLIYVAPDVDVVIVKLSAWPDAWVPELEMESYAFFDAVIEALGN